MLSNTIVQVGFDLEQRGGGVQRFDVGFISATSAD
jgi:hypothetical protein